MFSQFSDKCLVYAISIVLTLARKLTRVLPDSNTLSRFKLFTDRIYKVILQTSVCKLHLHSLTKHHILHKWHYVRRGSYVSFKIWIVCSLTTQVDWPIVWQL